MGSKMPGSSFSFGKFNSITDWNLSIIAYDVLIPAKRPRKLTIPGKDGVYDFGNADFEERTLRMSCIWEHKGGEIPRHIIREMAYHLSKKSQILLWNEPDKYYIGELQDPSEITDFPLERFKEFELNFICQPFAYGESRVENLEPGTSNIGVSI